MIHGYREARKFLKKYRPDVVFSKGGFVSVPVVRAAGSLHIPCVIHESDMTPGLANKLCFSSATKICCNFPETLKMVPSDKAVLTGTPIRGELFTGDRDKGLAVMGGSQGAVSVNNAVRGKLPELLRTFQIVHLCGKGHFDVSLQHIEGYRQFEYVKEDLKHLFAAADILVSRAGANAICEILALGKPSLLIPLPTKGSRGDQILNANSFAEQGFSEVIEDEKAGDLIVEKAVSIYENRDKGAGLQRGDRGREGGRPDRREGRLDLREPRQISIYENRDKYIAAMKESDQTDAIPIIMKLIEEVQK